MLLYFIGLLLTIGFVEETKIVENSISNMIFWPWTLGVIIGKIYNEKK
jgi:hypothetical protein